MALVRNTSYRIDERESGILPLADSSIVYQHSALGLSNGRVRALQFGDTFAGFAARGADSRRLAAGAAPEQVSVVRRGEVQLTVVGATAASLGAIVYASDENTFNITAGSRVGIIVRVPSDGSAVVSFSGLEHQFPAEQASALSSMINRRNVSSWSPFGRIQTVANGADTTLHTQFTLAAPATLMQIGIVNGTGADWAGCQGTIGRLSQSGNKSGTTVNAGTLGRLTVSGATTFTVVGTGGSNGDPIVTWTDMVGAASGVFAYSLDRTDTASTGGVLPVHNFRLQIPAAVANRSGWYDTSVSAQLAGWQDENITTAPYGRILRMRSQAGRFAGDNVTDIWANFTSTTNITNGLPFIVRYVPRTRIVPTILLLGNSIPEGASGTPYNHGWAHELVGQLSTTSRPIELCSLAVGSSTADNDVLRAVRQLQTILPTFVVHMPFNINNTGTGSTILQAEIDAMHLSAAQVRAECSRLGIPLILCTAPAGSTATWPWAATDSLRRTMNSEVRAFCAQAGIPLVDMAAVLDGSDDGTGMLQLNPALTDDGTHPNVAGHKAVAAAAAPIFRALLS